MRNRLSAIVATLLSTLALSACGDGGSGTETGTGGSSGSGTAGGSGGVAGDTGGSGGVAGGNGGTATGGTATGGSGGSAGSGGAQDDLSALDDEFDDAASLSDWHLLHEELGEPAPYTSLDIDSTAPGRLAITPVQGAWYMGDHATFLYKPVTGDFVVEVSAAAYKKGTASGAPTEPYNSAGLLLRDPASGPGSEDWLMYNIGYQDSFIGVEGKATSDSLSELILIPTAGAFEGRLRMCRIGDTVHMLRRLPGDAAWTETHTYPSTFSQTDPFPLPATLQVGIIDNAYGAADVRAETDYIHFARVDDPADCSAP